jgi:hypothetical protein
MSQSGYCVFWLLYFPVRAFSGYAIFGSAKKQGYCIFRYAIFKSSNRSKNVTKRSEIKFYH